MLKFLSRQLFRESESSAVEMGICIRNTTAELASAQLWKHELAVALGRKDTAVDNEEHFRLPLTLYRDDMEGKQRSLSIWI